MLGHSCARVCPVEVLCEGACVLNHEKQRPVAIGALQRVATDHVLDRGISVLKAGAPNGKRVVLVGAGPASLGCAAELARMGYACRIYDRREVPGGLNTHGIAAYKMRAADAVREVELVRSLGVEVRAASRSGAYATVDVALERSGRGVPRRSGSATPRSSACPGRRCPAWWTRSRSSTALKNRPFRDVPVGRNVVVIGAGNTSVDAATQAKRLGAENVLVVYRRGPEDVSAYHYEFELAKTDGVVYVFYAQPKQFLGNGAVEALECVRTETVTENGRAALRAIPGSEFAIPCDMAITAVGQKKHAAVAGGVVPRASRSIAGRVKTDATAAPACPRVYAGGDCVNGGKEVVNAVADGKARRARHRRGPGEAEGLMADLTTNFAGIKCPNPFWLASGPPTNTATR